jgi:uncharacterized protein (DUF2384 family)
MRTVAEELSVMWAGSAGGGALPQLGVEARYAEYKELVSRAVEVFGSDVEATRWLSSASADFGNRTPLQVLAQQGPAFPLEILGRIEHGVYF